MKLFQIVEFSAYSLIFLASFYWFLIAKKIIKTDRYADEKKRKLAIRISLGFMISSLLFMISAFVI